MRTKCILAAVVTIWAGRSVSAEIITAADVTGTGTFNNSLALLTDGQISPEQTAWTDNAHVWWTGTAAAFTFDYGAVHEIQDVTVSVDLNDAYLIEHSLDATTWNPLSVIAINDGINSPPFVGMDTMSSINTDPHFIAGMDFAAVNARFLRFSATAGDNAYSIGELQAFGQQVQTAAVPEPSSFVALAMGLMGFGFWRRRKQYNIRLMAPRGKTLSASLLILTAPSFGTAVRGDIIQADQSGTVQNAFDGNISTTDLIQATSATLLGNVAGTGTPGFGFAGSNDGTSAHTNGLTYWGGDNAAGQSLTYTLTGSATGYDITSVNSIYGWHDVRYRHAAQQWTLSVTTVTNANFTDVHTVVYRPFADLDPLQGSTQVTLTDDTGTIATGVTALRFNLLPYGPDTQTGYTGEIGVIREFDVFGAASAANVAAVPEPSTLAVIGIGLAGFGWWRRPREVAMQSDQQTGN